MTPFLQIFHGGLIADYQKSCQKSIFLLALLQIQNREWISDNPPIDHHEISARRQGVISQPDTNCTRPNDASFLERRIRNEIEPVLPSFLLLLRFHRVIIRAVYRLSREVQTAERNAQETTDCADGGIVLAKGSFWMHLHCIATNTPGHILTNE